MALFSRDNVSPLGSYNFEKVLNFSSYLAKSLNSVMVLEKYLISLLGLEKSLKFTTLSKIIFVNEQYLSFQFVTKTTDYLSQNRIVQQHFGRK